MEMLRNYLIFNLGGYMVEEFDLVIKNARIREEDELKNIGVDEDRISMISTEGMSGSEEVDAEGQLVTESFIDPHLHMDKVFTLQQVGEDALQIYQDEESGMGGAMSAIDLASRVKEEYDESWIYENAEEALKLGIKHGVLHHRAFVDVDMKGKLEGMKALLKLRDEYEGIVDLKVVAFPQDGLIKEPGAEELIEESLEMGADVVGGIPWIEHTDKEAKEHIDKMFDLATEYDKDIAMLTDDAGDPTLRTTEMLAEKALEENWEGRVTACHARAMEKYPDPYFDRLTGLLNRANLSIVSDPQTGPLHARIDELMDKGINVALGQDDISDAYYPYGVNSMIEVAFLVSHLTWKTTAAEMKQLYDMITVNAAKDLNVENYGLKEGNEANLVVLNTENEFEALRNQDVPRYVISSGEIVAENEFKTSFKI